MLEHHLVAVLKATLLVPTIAVMVATDHASSSGFDAVTAGLYFLGVSTALLGLRILNRVRQALDGDLPPIADALVRRWVTNPLRRAAGLPPLPVWPDDNERIDA